MTRPSSAGSQKIFVRHDGTLSPFPGKMPVSWLRTQGCRLVVPSALILEPQKIVHLLRTDGRGRNDSPAQFAQFAEPSPQPAIFPFFAAAPRRRLGRKLLWHESSTQPTRPAIPAQAPDSERGACQDALEYFIFLLFLKNESAPGLHDVARKANWPASACSASPRSTCRPSRWLCGERQEARCGSG